MSERRPAGYLPGWPRLVLLGVLIALVFVAASVALVGQPTGWLLPALVGATVGAILLVLALVRRLT